MHVPYNVSLDVHLLESCEESLEEASGFAAILKNADIFQCYDIQARKQGRKQGGKEARQQGSKETRK